MESIDIGVSRGIWGNRKCGWVSRQAIGHSGGIATFWDIESIQCSSTWHLNGILVVNAVRNSDLADLCLINIYAPCNPRDKKELWGILNTVIDQNRDKLICLAGDFNAVRNEIERVGRSGCTNKREMEDFDKFSRDSKLIDLPLSGRSYTWYRPDGSCKSRLDHFLLNEEWIACYPTTRLKGLPRSISNHCPLILEDGLIDWGPKPFRFSNAWLLHPSFKDSFISMWQNLNIGGRGSFIVKEKFKSLKIGLRDWSKNTFGLNINIVSLSPSTVILIHKHKYVEEGERRKQMNLHVTNTNQFLLLFPQSVPKIMSTKNGVLNGIYTPTVHQIYATLPYLNVHQIYVTFIF
ncbi:hypothetical protein ACS0TY_015889 [Phlomoides rotata]